MRSILLALALTACAKNDMPEPAKPSDATREVYSSAVSRLTTGFLENGWVVSRHDDRTPEHQGEGLLWTGIWLYASPCAQGAASDAMLRETILRRDGALVRYEPLGEYEGGRDVTLDGALGLYRGIADSIVRCNRSDLWTPVLSKHLAYLIDHQGKLNEAAPTYLIDEFAFIPQALGARLGLVPDIEPNDVRRLEAVVAAWAALVNATHEAAYRAHLGLIALQTMQDLGYEVQWGGFCAATRGMGIATIENQCARAGLKEWIRDFQYNRYEYQFQRAVWETENTEGIQTPGLDFLVAIRDLYKL